MRTMRCPRFARTRSRSCGAARSTFCVTALKLFMTRCSSQISPTSSILPSKNIRKNSTNLAVSFVYTVGAGSSCACEAGENKSAMPTLTILEAVGLHILGPLVVAGLLFHINRGFRSSPIEHWRVSILARTVYPLASVGLGMRGSLPRSYDGSGMLLSSAVGGAAAFRRLGWMAWGWFEIAPHKSGMSRDSNRLLVVLI